MSLLIGIDEAPDKRGCRVQGRIDFDLCHGCRFEVTGIGCCFFSTGFDHLEHLDRELGQAGYRGGSFAEFFRDRADPEGKVVLTGEALQRLAGQCARAGENLRSNPAVLTTLPLLNSLDALVKKALAINEPLEVS